MLKNWINKVLAAFKQKNPKVWAIIAVLLTAAQITLNQLVSSGVIPEGAEWLEWAIWAIGLLLGSGEVAKYKFKKELEDNTSSPELLRNGNIPDSKKVVILEEKNRKLRNLIERA